jgi:hypothetical protein
MSARRFRGCVGSLFTVVALTGVALSLAAIVASPAAAATCADDALLREFQDSGDAFRAVTVLRQRELERRGTPEGFECARLILGAYLHHGELELVDDWVARLGQHYASLMPPSEPLRLRVEVAYLIGNSAEVKHRADESGLPGLETLTLLAQAADVPFSFDARATAACNDAACVGLRRILDTRERVPHKSAGLALVLGIVPGLGQVYAGRPLAGLGSFLLNSFLIGTSAYAVHRHEYALSVLSGGIGVAFYAASIYAGYEAATRFNDREAEQLRSEIRALPVELTLNKLAM